MFQELSCRRSSWQLDGWHMPLLLAPLAGLTALAFDFCHCFASETLRHISMLTGLRRLSLRDMSISDTGQ